MTADEDFPGSELVPAEPRRPPASLGQPSRDEWMMLIEQCNMIASTKLVPAKLFGKPAELVAVALMARDVQRSLMWGLRYLWISPDGKVAMQAEGMVSLVISGGYDIWPIEATRTVARAGWKRGDREGVVEYDIGEAISAGLVHLDEDGVPRSRSDNGKPMAWEKFTGDMLWARCVSRVVRRVFADVLGGISYVPEELGAHVDPETGETEAASPNTITVEQARSLRARIRDLPDEQTSKLRKRFMEMGVVISKGKDTKAEPLRPILPASWLERIEEELASIEAEIPPKPPTAPPDDSQVAEGELMGDQAPPAPEGSEDAEEADVVVGKPAADELPPEESSIESRPDLEGPTVFNGDTGHCGKCGSPIWFDADTWKHAEDADAEAGGRHAAELAGPEVNVDRLYLASHPSVPPAILKSRIAAEVGAMSSTKILAALTKAKLGVNGPPQVLKQRWLEHRLATELGEASNA